MKKGNGQNIEAPPGYTLIHGRLYKHVAKRVEDFWTTHSPSDYGFRTTILQADENIVRIRAEIVQHGICPGGPYEVVIGVGHAEEQRSAGSINKVAAVENCETSAIGRALACIGYGGSDNDYASADEMLKAMHMEDVMENGAMSPVKMRKYVDGMLKAAERDDVIGLMELWDELTDAQKEWLWRTQFRSYERSMLDKKIREGQQKANPPAEPDISGAGA